MKDKLIQVIETLLDDALEPDPTARYYKMSDKDMITLISNLCEYVIPKQTRSLLRDGTGAPKELGF